MKYWILVPFSIILLTGLEGCSRETPPAVNSGAIIWKWEKEHSISASFIYQDKLILLINGKNEPCKVLALSQASGERIWESEGLDFPGYYEYLLDVSIYAEQSGNKLLIAQGVKIYAVDLDNGKIIWDAELDAGLGDICVIDDFVYEAAHTDEKSTLYRYNIHNGVKEHVFELNIREHGGGNMKPVICLPVKWTDTWGNELIIIPNSGFHLSDEDSSRLDIYAWNLTADSLEWQREDVDIRSSGKTLIEGNRVYFPGKKRIHCLDASSGNTLWSSQFNSGYSISYFDFNLKNSWIINDKFVTIGDDGKIFGFDKLTGKKIWSTSTGVDLLFAISRVHNNIIWINNTNLLAVDGNTGDILVQWNNDITTFWNNTTVGHPSSGYIFTADRSKNVFCLDIEKMK